MHGKSDLIRIKRKPFFFVLFILILAIATPVLADYLGPNRAVTETISVCKVVLYECQYVPARDLWKYKPVDDWSCSNEGKPWQGYDNYNGECGLFSKGRTQWGKQEKLQTVTTTQPEATITSVLQGCALNNGWCNTASELSLNGTEPLSGYSILAVEGTLNGQSFACSGDNCAVPLNEGDNDFTFWALSSWGDSSQMGTFTAKVDTVSPTLGLDIMATGGSNGWYVSSTSLTAIGFDSTSGLSSVFLSVDNGAWQSSTTLNEGVYNVLVQAEDNAGNVAQSPTVISVDTTTPTIDVSVNGTTGNNGWYSSGMQVSATANDATSGVGSLESILDGRGYQAYNSPVSFADGYHTVQFKAVDKAGNETETFVQEFYVDTIAPAVDLPARWEVNDAINYKVQDDGSGLSALRIVIEDEDEKYAKVAWDEAVSGNKFKGEIMWDGKFKDGTVAPAGEYLVWVKTTDVAGNEHIGLGRVIVPQPFASFSLIQPSKPSTEVPTPPADLFVPKDTSPTTEDFNPIPSSSTSFGGSTSPTNSTSVQSRTLSSGTASASTTTSTNVLWGATAAALIGWATATALEEKKKRKEQEQAQAAQVKAQVDTFNEAQEAKRLAEMKQWKINSWLEGQAILNAQVEQLEGQGASPKEIDALKEKAKTEGLGVARNEAGILGAEISERKMKEAAQADMTEQEKWQAYTSTPEYVARQERLAEWQQAEEKKKAQDLQDGLAAYYAAMRQGEQEVKYGGPKVSAALALDDDPPPSKWDNFWQGIKNWWNNLFVSKQSISTPDVSAIQTKAAQTFIAQLTQTAQATPTSTPTAMPTFTLTSTPTPILKVAYITSQDVNLRTNPMIVNGNLNVVTQLACGTSLQLMGEKTIDAEYVWQKVKVGNVIGWVVENFLDSQQQVCPNFAAKYAKYPGAGETLVFNSLPFENSDMDYWWGFGNTLNAQELKCSKYSLTGGWHNGLDFSPTTGTPLVWNANLPGKVVMTNNNPISYGAGPNNILIQAGGFVVLYGENSNEIPLWKLNDIVEPGAIVGLSGEHLHFEIRPASSDNKTKSRIYINPLTFFAPKLQAYWAEQFAGDYASEVGQDPLSLGYYTTFPSGCP